MNILETIEKEQMDKLAATKDIPEFAAGDTIKVHVKIKEGENERIQIFEGVCISRKNAGINSGFTVRKLSFGEGVERVFPLYSPNVAKIEVLRRGDVRRAKLYYLRGRTGKSARIAEKTTGWAGKVSNKEAQVAREEKAVRDAKAREKAQAKKAAKADAAKAEADAK